MKLKFLKQRSVNEKSRVSLPNEVINVLYPNKNFDGKDIYWNIDQQNNDVIISTKMLKEENSDLIDLLVIHNDNKSIVIAEDVRDTFSISKNDDIYFTAPKGIEEETPAVFVWTLEKINQAILTADHDSFNSFPRYPHF